MTNYALREPPSYHDWSSTPDPDDARPVLAVDQEKFNLAWLVTPTIETDGLAAVPKPLAAVIHEYMDQETRARLTDLPLQFLAYWVCIDCDGLALASAMPVGYRKTMEVRAREAQHRLTGESNVVRVDFRSKTWEAAALG